MANGNPRLEVEVAVSGLGKATKDFGTLQKQLQDTSKEFSKANATALELEAELKSLSTALARGAISQNKYDKEVKDVSIALSSARQAAQQYQARISSLNATIEQGANTGRQYGNAVKGLQGVHDSVSKGIRGSASVSVELSRVLQDMPYGIQGVANNFQQLTTNLGHYTKNIREALIAQGQQATTMNVVKTALSGLISPISLITFGVSALTSALVLFDRSQQQANKEIKEAEKEVKVLANSYSVLSNALKEDTSYKNAISSVNSLKINVGLAKEGIIDKKKVVEEYNKTIGDSAGKLKTFAEVEDFIVKKSDAYIQAMLLRASANLALEEAAKAAVEAQRLAINPPKVETKLVGDNSIANEFLTTQGRVIEQAGTFVRKKLTDDAKKTEKTFTDIAKDFQTKAAQINKQYGFNLFGDGKSGRESGTRGKSQADLIKEANEALRGGQIDNLRGIDKELEKIDKKWDGILEKINKVANAGLKEQLRLQVEQGRELDKQLAKLDAWAKSPKLKPITGKDALTITPTLSGVPSIQPLLDSRAGRRAATPPKIDFSNELSKEIKKGISRGIGSAFSDLYNTIGNLGSNFYEVFSNVFQKLSGYVGNIMSDVIGRYLGEQLSKKIEDGEFQIGGLSTKLSSALVLGASMAGQVLGGMVSRESVAGQGVAGALTGAASGAAIGASFGAAAGPIGAVVGGVVGLIGGIFGAKSAKREREKQEELQRQQLAEQKKQTALMERQAMLSYSASVIGQMTNAGVVTSVERDAFGNLVADIKGKDLQLILDRNKNGRG